MFKPIFSLSCCNLVSNCFSESSSSAIITVSPAYLMLNSGVPFTLKTTSDMILFMIACPYIENKSGDSTHPWRTPPLIEIQVLCCFPILMVVNFSQ